MTIGWVAASTRGRALERRLVGEDGARSLVGLDWPQARQALTSTVYGRELDPDAGRADARRAAMEATTWQLRVLAGWLPPGQGGLVRLFAAPMEISNIEMHLASLGGYPIPSEPIRLGSLAVAWPRVARARSAVVVRSVLATSVWGDPGGVDRAEMALGLRLAWARRLADVSPIVSTWVKGGAAVLVAREQFVFGRDLNDPTRRVADSLLGRGWLRADSLGGFRQALGKAAGWPFDGIEEPASLWRAEAAVAHRVSTDTATTSLKAAPSRDRLVQIMVRMLVDLRHVLTMIELAGRSPDPTEAFDAVA